jgi:hypothetical protein
LFFQQLVSLDNTAYTTNSNISTNLQTIIAKNTMTLFQGLTGNQTLFNI